MELSYILFLLLKLLDRAEEILPDYAWVHHYRSNIACLMGDIEAAIHGPGEGVGTEAGRRALP